MAAIGNRVEQLGTDAASLQPAIDNQFVDIDELAIQQIGRRAITREADDAARVGRGEQAIAVGMLPRHPRGERVRVCQTRAQLTHDVECGQQRIRRVEVNEAKRGGHVRLHEERRSRYPVSQPVEPVIPFRPVRSVTRDLIPSCTARPVPMSR